MSVSEWKPDPTGRHQYRWWDGEEWTEQVSDNGKLSEDPVGGSLPPPNETSDTGGRYAAEPDVGSADAGMGRVDRADLSSADLHALLSSKGRRFGALLLELVLTVVTLGIGWIIWTLIILGRGQTPAKQVLRMRVVRLTGSTRPIYGLMAVREILLKTLLPGAISLLVPFLNLAWLVINGIVLLVDKNLNQTVWDRWLKTTVIDDPNNLYG